MRKSDLKDMMIVEMRDGERYVVVGDRLYYGAGFFPLNTFTDDLKHSNRTYESEDIVKVYDSIDYLPTTDDLEHAEQLCTLLWERKEDDPDLPFNGKAVYTGQAQTSGNGYTVGKVYEFNGGKTTDDDGTRRPIVDSGIPILDAIPSANFLTERELKIFGFLKLIE